MFSRVHAPKSDFNSKCFGPTRGSGFLNPSNRTAVPFGGQTTPILSSLYPKTDPKRLQP